MNEQELADLFSAQIDGLLSGELAVNQAVDGNLSLFALGQHLIEINFQPSPAAQAAFQGQLASWFGSAGGGLSLTIFGGPKVVLMSLGTVLGLISAGLITVVLISFMWTGAFFDSSGETRPEQRASPALVSPAATVAPSSTPTATRPRNGSSLKDTLPPATRSVGDTISRSTPTPLVNGNNPAATATPVGTPGSNASGDDESSDAPGDPSATGDHDHGHGNDLDGYDNDNPGQSDGVSGGNDGISPDNLSGGSGSNGGGGNNSGSGNNSGGGNNGGGNGGGKGNK